ncbi:hypothetical protein FQN57_003609 [Myotisia sp. PD_48]|nr:hypothetical protein FQN57_003609 [Myotisia sp. PD_48]
MTPPGERPTEQGTAARQAAFKTWKTIMEEWNPFDKTEKLGADKHRFMLDRRSYAVQIPPTDVKLMDALETYDAHQIPTHTNVSLVIHTQDRINHWALYAEAEGYDNGIAYHVKGGMGFWCFEAIYTNPRESDDYAEIILICRMLTSKVGVGHIYTVADKMIVPTDDYTWNCQNFVIELLGAMGAEGLVDVEDAAFIKGVETIQARKET